MVSSSFGIWIPLPPLWAAFLLHAPPGKDEKNFFYQKNDDYNNHRLCVLFLWLRSGIEKYAGKKLSPCCQFFVSGFVGLLTYLFMCRGFSLAQTHCFSLLSGPWQPIQWPVFTARKFLCTENNALEIQLLSEFCLLLYTLWFIDCKRREEIPSVSGILTRFPCSANKHACPRVACEAFRLACFRLGRACATKAMICSFYTKNNRLPLPG